MELQDLYWHDSELLNIHMHRAEDRKTDSIEFEVDWIDIGIKKIVFLDVYWSSLEMCMGTIGPESFAEASIVGEDDADVIRHVNHFSKFNEQPITLCYLLTTHNGSKIKIIARTIEFVED